jgi:hypothetical protein
MYLARAELIHLGRQGWADRNWGVKGRAHTLALDEKSPPEHNSLQKLEMRMSLE